jgi:hypothetical protein
MIVDFWGRVEPNVKCVNLATQLSLILLNWIGLVKLISFILN